MQNRMWTGDREFELWGKMFGERRQPYVVRQLYKYEEQMKYELGKLPIGVRTEDPDEVFFLNLKKSNHITILGGTGVGKTTFLGGCGDRIQKGGGRCFQVDPKGEFLLKNKPLQPMFHKFLLKKEQPQPLDIISYHPYFFIKFVHRKLVETEHYLQFSLEDINKFDLITLLGARDEGSIQLVDAVWIEYENKTVTTWEEMIDYIDKECQHIHHQTRKKISNAMNNLIDNKIIGDEVPPPDITKNLNDGMFVNLNFKGIMQYGTFANPASTYLAIILRRIYNAKVFGELNRKDHHFIFIDELARFCPRTGNSNSKSEILKLLDLSRSERISMWFSTQDYKRVPDTILKQSNYIFIPYTGIDLEDVKKIIQGALPHEYDVPQTFGSKVSSILANLKKYKDGRRDWLVLDKRNKDYHFVQPFLPLSHLMQEGD